MMTYYDCKAEEARTDNFVVDAISKSLQSEYVDEFTWFVDSLDRLVAEGAYDYRDAKDELDGRIELFWNEHDEWDEEEACYWVEDVAEIVAWVGKRFDADENYDDEFKADAELGWKEALDVVRGWIRF